MLRDNRLRLLTLGRLTLVGSSGEEHESLSKRRRKLALLAVLAMARRPIARDTLVEMFWGAEDEARARHSLSNALSSLRRALGAGAIRSRDADVAVAPDAPLIVDALELADAVEGREFGRAAELYAGPFLEGFFLDDSPSFEQWMSRERRRLEGLFLQACAQECAMLARARRWAECHALARRWLDAQPLSPDAALTLLNAARAPGSRAALAQALEDYETLKAHLEREFELSPEPPVRALAEQIREVLVTIEPDAPSGERAAAIQAPPPEAATSPENDAPAEEPAASFPPLPDTVTGTWIRPEPPPVRRRRARWALGAVALVGVVALLVVTRGVWRPAPSGDASGGKPVVAVLGMNLRTNDSALSWLADGFPQMIAGKLAHNSAVDVVPPSQVHAVLARSGHAGEAQLTDATARDLARRIGATFEARGTIVRDAGKLVLDLTVHDVGSGSLVQSIVVSRADPLALADEAAVRILGAANVNAPGERFVGLETSSLEAYQHFTQALDAADRGRTNEATRDLDAALALDSGFIAAVRVRIAFAVGDGDTSLTRRLRDVARRYADRASEIDRLDEEAEAAVQAGEHEKSEALARALLRRFPRDPRAYARLQSTLTSHGKNREAETVAMEALALDSLTVSAGNGPCAPCLRFFSLVSLHWADADFRGASDWARRWIRAQPDAASAWQALAWTYSYMQRPDSAILLIRRAMSLSGGDLSASGDLARMLLVSRRYAAADSVIAALQAGASTTDGHVAVADLRSLVAREHGRYRESSEILKRLVPKSESNGFVSLVLTDNMRWLGDYAGASRRYDSFAHPAGEHFSLPVPSPSARAWCWMHALAAEAYAPTGDTVALRVKADTLEAGCGRSFYARDWRLFHYVRGQIAAYGHRYAEAEREFTQAVWSKTEGWTPITVALANAQSAQGRPRDAIATLRTAYATRLDAMGRYVPISQLDYHMARAFVQAGEPDSARIYSSYVRAAWRDADPEIRRQLAQLP
jgi:DNA-binding SARP family transcriptional activator/tetratricopeptide (TPR) repeat protein